MNLRRKRATAWFPPVQVLTLMSYVSQSFVGSVWYSGPTRAPRSQLVNASDPPLVPITSSRSVSMPLACAYAFSRKYVCTQAMWKMQNLQDYSEAHMLERLNTTELHPRKYSNSLCLCTWWMNCNLLENTQGNIFLCVKPSSSESSRPWLACCFINWDCIPEWQVSHSMHTVHLTIASSYSTATSLATAHVHRKE